MKFSNLEELYKKLKIVFDIKLRILKLEKYNYIKSEDIWNFLSETKWKKDIDLGIAEIVNDIIHCDNFEIDIFLKDKLSSIDRTLYY